MPSGRLVAERLGVQLDHLDVADLGSQGLGEAPCGDDVSAKIAGTCSRAITSARSSSAPPDTLSAGRRRPAR